MKKIEKDFKLDRLKAILCAILVIIFIFVVIWKNDDIKEMILKGNDVSEENSVKTDALKFKKEYESLNGEKNANGKTYPKVEIGEDNAIKYSDASEVVKILDKGTGVIYLGYPKCPWCRNAIPVLLQAVKDTGVESIYYINMYDERDNYIVDKDGQLVKDKEGTAGYEKLLKALDDVLDDYIVKDDNGKEFNTGEKRIYVPYVIFVRDGEIVGIHDDTVKSQKDPYVPLDDKQQEELYNIYIGYIHSMLDDLCDEKC